MDLESEIYTYAYDRYDEKNLKTMRKSLVIEFVNDNVNGYIYNNSIDDASSNIDLTKCKSLVKNRTTLEEAIEIFGQNYGVIKKPSNLFRGVLLEQFGGFF